MALLDISMTYLEALQSKGRKPETLRAYARDLALLLGFVGDVEPKDVTAAQIEEFLVLLAAEGKAVSSIIRARDVIRAFWGWMGAEQFVTSNPTESLSHGTHLDAMDGPRPKPAARASTDQITAVLAHLTASEDRLITSLVALTGLPASDILGLTVENVSFHNDHHPEMPGGIAVLKTRIGLGSDRHIVVAEPEIVRALERQASPLSPSEPLFHVPMRTLQHRFRIAALTAGLPDLTLRNVRRSSSLNPFQRLRLRKA